MSVCIVKWVGLCWMSQCISSLSSHNRNSWLQSTQPNIPRLISLTCLFNTIHTEYHNGVITPLIHISVTYRLVRPTVPVSGSRYCSASVLRTHHQLLPWPHPQLQPRRMYLWTIVSVVFYLTVNKHCDTNISDLIWPWFDCITGYPVEISTTYVQS